MVYASACTFNTISTKNRLLPGFVIDRTWEDLRQFFLLINYKTCAYCWLSFLLDWVTVMDFNQDHTATGLGSGCVTTATIELFITFIGLSYKSPFHLEVAEVNEKAGVPIKGLLNSCHISTMGYHGDFF